jgi:hypothetical protein
MTLSNLGPVGMNDVAYFLTGCLSGEVDQQLIDGIERASIGVPVYKCKMSKEDGVTRPVPIRD